MIVFVFGGTRSGKTRYAINFAEGLFHYSNFYYIATAEPIDEEMKERIKKHQEERSEKWELIEEPVNLVEKLKTLPENSVILIDCLSVWLTNLIVKNLSIEENTQKLLEELKRFKACPEYCLICVSSEVGLGLVPESTMGRKFRDLNGFFNQKLAELADEVYFVVAGLPITLKSL